jgi:hypothetical protein
VGLENGYRKYFIVNSETKSPIYALDKKPPANLMVWDWITRNMGEMNSITVPQAELSRILGVHRVWVGRVLKDLEEAKLIVKNGKSQHNNIYMVNPDKVWKGSPKKIGAGREIFARLQGNKQKLL